MKKFFDYIQLPNFDIAADAAATFKVKLVSQYCHVFIFVKVVTLLKFTRHCCTPWYKLNAQNDSLCLANNALSCGEC